MKTHTLYVPSPLEDRLTLLDLAVLCDTSVADREANRRREGFTEEQMEQLIEAQRLHSEGKPWGGALNGKLRDRVRAAKRREVQGGFETEWSNADGLVTSHTGAVSVEMPR